MLTQSATFPVDEWVEVNVAQGIPEISILMPLYEQEEFVREAVLSIVNQKGVTAEICISDDSSEDSTFAVALQHVLSAVGKGRIRHRIVMRRGSTRLWRDHVHLIAKYASCDLLCQAHGDDVSHPQRAAAIALCAQLHPQYAMFVSRFREIRPELTDEGEFSELTSSLPLLRIPVERTIKPGNALVGSGMAWRRSSLLPFGELEARAIPTSHDRIMAFRAALSGGLMLIEAPLYKRRRHSRSASAAYFHQRNAKLQRKLVAMVRGRVMSHDAQVARDLGLISDEAHRSIERTLTSVRLQELDSFVELYVHQLVSGVDLCWRWNAE